MRRGVDLEGTLRYLLFQSAEISVVCLCSIENSMKTRMMPIAKQESPIYTWNRYEIRIKQRATYQSSSPCSLWMRRCWFKLSRLLNDRVQCSYVHNHASKES